MVNFNGDLLPDSNHFLNHKNRGLQFGDALSEQLRYTGSTLLFWEDHYFRLMAAMRQLRMDIPMDFTLEYLEGEIVKTVEASGGKGLPNEVRITVFRNAGNRMLPDVSAVSYVIDITPLTGAEYPKRTPALLADLFKDYYVQADGLSRLPHNSKLPFVLAAIYAEDNGYDTCLILNHRKEVALGLHGNLFLRRGPEIKTPPLSAGCPDGILRGFLLKQQWEKHPYQLVEGEISPFELQQADELFMADITTGITSVGQYRKAHYSRDAAHFITTMLNDFIGETA